MRSISYRRHFSRRGFFREWMIGRALRRRRPDFSHERPMISIIGDHISDIIRAEQLYERDILLFLRHRVLDADRAASQSALDVGANIGNHSLFLSNIFKRVIAFEPNPVARSILMLNLELNAIANVEVRPVGLADQRGQATLAFDPTNLGATRSSRGAHSKQAPTHREIELVVGDQEIDQLQSIGFIKIDVEGAEEDVLKGLTRTIETHQPILMIEQRGDVINATSGTSPAFSLLDDLGYTCWEIETGRLFRGPLARTRTLLLGYVDYSLRAVPRLDKRDYPALIFTPPSYAFPQPS